jgi:hypothetical protein
MILYNQECILSSTLGGIKDVLFLLLFFFEYGFPYQNEMKLRSLLSLRRQEFFIP